MILIFLLFQMFIFMFSVKGLSKLIHNLKPIHYNRYYRYSFQKYLSTSNAIEEEHKSGVLKNFITNIIDDDINSNRNGKRVVTRFPPEPNGYLHLGHAKSINLNFALSKEYNGVTHMRLDDTNPAKEDIEYVNSILEDVRWLVTGDRNALEAPWYGNVRHASDYFQVIYDAAEYLIRNGLAYVDNLTPEEMKEYRGTLTEPGKNSPYRDRTIEENLKLFQAMKAGEYQDGFCILRAKIDMASPNINLRDPALYRIKKDLHPMTGDKWCIYPMYDFAHAISDAIEGITHSLCTLEFDNHRPLYDWIIDNLQPSGLLPYQQEGWRPRQYEFSRLNLQYTVLSKRKLIQLVTEKYVNGWDDPRMPTISGMRRRGYSAKTIRLFCDRVGISKVENNIDITVLEDCAREVLDAEAPRLFAIMNPLKMTITNWLDDHTEIFSIEEHSKRLDLGTRDMPFTGTLYIDRDDFFDTGLDGSIVPPKGYKRLLPNGQVRLKYAYVITCNEVIRDPHTNEVLELKCTYDINTKSGNTPEGTKKVKGIIQWVSQKHAIKSELYLYDRLFLHPSPGKDQPDGDFLKDLNPNSLTIKENAVVEPSILDCIPGDTFQFERIGYFTIDIRNNMTPLSKMNGMPLKFNSIVSLKDNWAATSGGGEGITIEEKGIKNSNSNTDKKSNTIDSNNNNNSNAVVIEDIRRVELRVGKILSVERHPDADTLYVEQVDCGDSTGPRTVVSGLVNYIPIDQLINQNVVVVCNLKPAKMRGILSEGMLLAASIKNNETNEEIVELLKPPMDATIGELIQISGYDISIPDPQLKSKSALDMFKRISNDFITNHKKEATYGKENNIFMTSKGPCIVNSLINAQIR